MDKSAYHHGELPQTLMGLALEHIAAHGTEKLSLRALAREAGVSPTAPYRHFATKQSLLAELATQGFSDLRRRIQKAVAGEGDSRERFVQMGVAYLDFAIENPTVYHLMFGAVLGDFSEYQQLADAGEASFAEMQNMLQQLADDTHMSYDMAMLSGVVWSGVHGMASLLLNKLDGAEKGSVSGPQQSLAAMAKDREMALRVLFGALLPQS